MSALYPIPDFLAMVDAEWQRARELFPGQEEEITLHEWLAVVVEEIGEISRDLNEQMLGNITSAQMFARLRVETIQSAAMLGRMFSCLDRLQRLGAEIRRS